MDYTPLNSKKNNNNNSLNYRKITINNIPLLHHFNPLHIPPVIIHILTINHTLQDTPIYGNMFLSELLVYMQKKHKHRSYWGSPYFFGNSNHPYFHGIFHYKHLSTNHFRKPSFLSHVPPRPEAPRIEQRAQHGLPPRGIQQRGGGGGEGMAPG